MSLADERIVNCANALARYYYAVKIDAAQAIANGQLLSLESYLRKLNLDEFNQDGLTVTPGDRCFHFLALKQWLQERHNCPACKAARLTVNLKGDFYCKNCFYSEDDDKETS